VLYSGGRVLKEYPWRVSLNIKNGTVLVGSDLHIWPGEASTCLRAFKKFIKDLKPDAIVLNGDVLDFPRLSRHPQSWETAPDPVEEIEAAQDHLHDMEMAAKKGCQRVWTAGNHDMRLELRIANTLPQFRGLKGIHLSDYFSPTWRKAWSCRVNEQTAGGDTMIRHRPKGGGKNATRLNVETAGIHTVHGHLHRQNVVAISDYTEFDKYGVDTGCIADKDHRAFLYTEDSQLDWRSGFALLTFKNGRLMLPDLINKWSNTEVQFRGEIIKV
jgi:UDP-2,3-diacylglucosamine pyrophosphatase LpxH